MKFKSYLILIAALMFATVSCEKSNVEAPGQEISEEETPGEETPGEETPEEETPGEETPGEETPEPIHITLETHDNMTYTGGDLFKAKVNVDIKLTLENVGQLPKESMGHNLVVLTPGTDHAEFGAEAFKVKDEDYIPATFASSIVAHTKLLGPGESDEIIFKFDEVGAYTFVCSFPGHWGTMHGTIIVE